MTFSTGDTIYEQGVPFANITNAWLDKVAAQCEMTLAGQALAAHLLPPFLWAHLHFTTLIIHNKNPSLIAQATPELVIVVLHDFTTEMHHWACPSRLAMCVLK